MAAPKALLEKERLEWKTLHVICLLFNPKDSRNYGDVLHQVTRAKLSPRETERCLGVV